VPAGAAAVHISFLEAPPVAVKIFISRSEMAARSLIDAHTAPALRGKWAKKRARRADLACALRLHSISWRK